MNRYRVTAFHIVFFIFTASDVGGCLTPIGDPPLFLGFLKGVPFWWAAEHCVIAWLIAVLALTRIFYVLDSVNFHRAPKPLRVVQTASETWKFRGRHILGCAALILSRCLTIEEAYEAVDWRIVILLAGVLPLGLAMEKTGAAQLLVQHVLGVAGYAHPAVMLSLLYLVTAILTEFMSNTAAAALLAPIAPIALSTAAALGVSPRPFLMAVAFAASTSFATPIGYQTNTMVYNIGGYRFADFLKVGVPPNVIF